MKSQKIRKTILFLSFLLFPIFYNYISPIIMIEGASNNIFSASLLYWILFFISSLFIGRAACSYICPMGAVQTIVDSVIGQKYKKIKGLHIDKYIIFIIWIGAFLGVTISSGGFKDINLLYNTEKVFSVDSVGGLIRYYIIVSVPLIFATFFGRMGFCHYFCPFSVFSIMGVKISKAMKLPTLHIESDSQKCIGCKKCEEVCPLNNQVSIMVRQDTFNNESCELCGECCTACKQGAIKRCFGAQK